MKCHKKAQKERGKMLSSASFYNIIRCYSFRGMQTCCSRPDRSTRSGAELADRDAVTTGEWTGWSTERQDEAAAINVVHWRVLQSY